MTLEQENELVARWMGWNCLKDGNGASRWVPPNAPQAFNVMACEPIPPDYRTDPALLWELMERLLDSQEWGVYKRDRSPTWVIEKRWKQIGKDTLAEAVFAAAVVQAEQEGK